MIWFLAGIIAAAPLYLVRFHIANLPTTLLEVLIVAFLFLTVVRFKIKDLSKILNLGKINWAIGLFVLAGVISTIISPEFIRALGLLRAFILEPVLVFYAIVLTVDSKQLPILFRALFWAAVGVSAFGIFQYFSFIHLLPKFWGYGEEPRRIVSIFAHPNALSLYLAPLLGFFSVLWLNNYPLTKNRIVSLIGLLLLGLGVLLTFSRGAWLAVAVAMFFIFVNRFGIKKILLPLVIAGTVLLLIPSVQQRLSVGLSDPSSSAHFDLMQVGMNKILNNPLFGNGLYGFRITLQEVNFTGEIHNYPHNIILSLWVELGLLGLISFAAIINLALKKYRPKPELFAASIFLLTMLVHGLVDTPYFRNDLALLFWFMIAIFFV